MKLPDSRVWVTFLILLGLVFVVGKSPNPHAHHGATPTPSPTPSPHLILAWNAPNDSSVQGYHLWIGFGSGQETLTIDVGNMITWTVELTSGTTYYFVVTAYNSGGDSLPSNEVSYTAP